MSAEDVHPEKSQIYGVRILEKKHTIDILIYMYGRESVIESELRAITKRGYGYKDILIMLADNGLAECAMPDPKSKSRKVITWWLTDKGRVIAKMLEAADRQIKDVVDPDTSR